MLGIVFGFILINIIFILGVIFILLGGIKILKGTFTFIVTTIKSTPEQKEKK